MEPSTRLSIVNDELAGNAKMSMRAREQENRMETTHALCSQCLLVCLGASVRAMHVCIIELCSSSTTCCPICEV